MSDQVTSYKQDQEFFLRCLFPRLGGEFIEIRPLKAGNSNGYGSFSASIEEAIKAAEQIPGDYDVLIGVATRWRKKGGNDSCKTWGAIGLDYDQKEGRLTKQDILNKFEALDLQLAMIVFSGHGYHAYLAIEPSRNAELVGAIVKKLAEATGADMQATKREQLLRLPGTYNNKYDDVQPVELLYPENPKDPRRYSVDDLRERLQITERSRRANNQDQEDRITCRPCVNAMLQGVAEGERNFTLGCIVQQLRLQGYTKQETRQEVKRWNMRCDPPEKAAQVEAAFNGYWHANYSMLACTFKDIEKQSILSHYCDQAACAMKEGGELDVENSVELNNAQVFRDYGEKSGNDLIILGVILRYPAGLNTKQLIKNLTSPANNKIAVSRSVMIESLRKLESWGLIESRKSPRKKGQYDFFRAAKKNTFRKGYTLASNGAIDGAIDKRITPAVLKLYILLLKFKYRGSAVYPSEVHLSDIMRVGQSNINKMKKQLVEGGYMRMEIVIDEKTGHEYRKYILLK